MNFVVTLLIVAIQTDAPIAARYPGAIPVFHCNFDASWDANFDSWPDNWTRRRGLGYPHYVTIAISREPSPTPGRCLRIDLDGEAAAAFSPPVEVTPHHSYVLEGFLKTEGLKHDHAYLSLTVLDRERRQLESFRSTPMCGSQPWEKLRLGPVSSCDPQACWAVIGVHLEPGDRADLTGTAMFNDLWLGRLPKVSLRANHRHHVYGDSDTVEITCTVSGFEQDHPTVTFLLEDVFGETLAREQRSLEVSDEDVEGARAVASAKPPRIGTVIWKPPLPGPGFYRLRAWLEGHEVCAHRQGLTLAVIRRQGAADSGEFGWSLPRGDRPLELGDLATLLAEAGIRWVKFPVWYEEKASDQEIARLIGFSERLSAQGMELVGMLHNPPVDVRTRYEDSAGLTAAEIFSPAPSLWYPSLELVMMRLATQIRWWQLGSDKDTSFVGYPDLPGKIREVKSQLDRIAQDANLGFGWSWMHRLPQDERPAWKFLSLSADPPLTDHELEDYLKATRQAQVKRWVTIEPLPRQAYPLQVRAGDLVNRLLSAKIHGADAIFVPDPFDPQCGLMQDDGTPGELFLPWRNTALMLSGSRHLGSIQLPAGSRNQVFARDGAATMVVWNHEPTREILYLGDDVQQMDLWSRRRVPGEQDRRQIIEAGPLPSFVTGLDLAVTRMRQSCTLAVDRIPSTFGMRHRNELRVTNTFDTGIAGRVTLVAPDVWSLTPDRGEFRLAQGESFSLPFEILLPYNAASGRQTVRADFEIQADRGYRFSTYRTIHVGLGDVYIEIATRQNEQGDLEVEQRFANETAEPVSFRCELFVPNRRRLRTEVVGLGQGRDVKVYHLRNAEELIGRTLWLRAEELGGSRVLNYRFRAER